MPPGWWYRVIPTSMLALLELATHIDDSRTVAASGIPLEPGCTARRMPARINSDGTTAGTAGQLTGAGLSHGCRGSRRRLIPTRIRVAAGSATPIESFSGNRARLDYRDSLRALLDPSVEG